MTKDEALKLTLEALETNNKAWKHLANSGDAGFWEAEEQPFYEVSVKAITAIKEALMSGTDGAQPEPEYIAFMDTPQRKPLTDEEIGEIAVKSQDGISPHDDTLRFARAIEAAHGIKGEA